MRKHAIANQVLYEAFSNEIEKIAGARGWVAGLGAAAALAAGGAKLLSKTPSTVPGATQVVGKGLMGGRTASMQKLLRFMPKKAGVERSQLKALKRYPSLRPKKVVKGFGSYGDRSGMPTTPPNDTSAMAD